MRPSALLKGCQLDLTDQNGSDSLIGSMGESGTLELPSRSIQGTSAEIRETVVNMHAELKAQERAL